MAELRSKVKLALDEARMLVLGSQVLLGFQFRSFFEQRFDQLPASARYLNFSCLLLMLVAMLLLILPAAFHRIVEQGEATEEQHRFTGAVMDFALLPFAVVLGTEIYLAMREVESQRSAVVCALAATLITFFFWYGLEWWMRARRNGGNMTQNETSGCTPLKDKIDHVLTECRVVLPGVQALLGFQFATTLMEDFQKLPPSSKYLHLVSLGFIALSMVLLMTPAAFHRIVEEGEETERFHHFASRMMLAALVPLALGVSGDLFVVARKLTDSVPLALGLALGATVICLSVWFGITGWIRITRHERMLKEASAAI